MSGDQIVSAIAGLMCLTLVGSSLVARRLAVGTTLRLALIWLAVFAAATFVVSLVMQQRSAASGREPMPSPPARTSFNFT